MEKIKPILKIIGIAIVTFIALLVFDLLCRVIMDAFGVSVPRYVREIIKILILVAVLWKYVLKKKIDCFYPEKNNLNQLWKNLSLFSNFVGFIL